MKVYLGGGHLCNPFKNVCRAVTYSEWPVNEAYPTYCNGWLYAMRPTVAEKLFLAARVTNLNHVDDIYVTGLVRHRYA